MIIRVEDTPEKLSKQIYSLAFHRASAVLREKNKDEFTTLLEAHKANIRMELELTGTIDTRKGGVTHSEGENGLCVKCGKRVPCRAMRVRAAKALAQERIAEGG